MGGSKGGESLERVSPAITRPRPDNPRTANVDGPQTPTERDANTVIPNLTNAVIEQAVKAPAPSGGTTGQAINASTPVDPVGRIQGAKGGLPQEQTRRAFSVALPEGALPGGGKGASSSLDKASQLLGAGGGKSLGSK
jgi:hypothetical protein